MKKTIQKEQTTIVLPTLDKNDLQITLVDNNPASTNKIRLFNVLVPISETRLDVGEGNKEYDLRKQ